jgi:hypothetical protein
VVELCRWKSDTNGHSLFDKKMIFITDMNNSSFTFIVFLINKKQVFVCTIVNGSRSLCRLVESNFLITRGKNFLTLFDSVHDHFTLD